MSNLHDEKYSVTFRKANSTTLKLTVTAVNTGGDFAVEQIHFVNCLPTGYSTLTGLEDPQDETAVIYANSTDFLDAKTNIKVGSTVYYTSDEVGGIEDISHVGWVT